MMCGDGGEDTENTKYNRRFCYEMRDEGDRCSDENIWNDPSEKRY